MLTDADKRRITLQVEFFSGELTAEVPRRIHVRGTDDGHGLGGPPFAPEFLSWIDAGSAQEANQERRLAKRGIAKSHDPRQRATRAFRKVRRVAPREYFVLWLVCMKSMSVPTVTQVMNLRSEAGGHPERYTTDDVTLLLQSGLDKASKWYSDI